MSMRLAAIAAWIVCLRLCRELNLPDDAAQHPTVDRDNIHQPFGLPVRPGAAAPVTRPDPDGV